MNVSSLNSNFDEFVLMINYSNTKFDVTVLSETWLSVSFNFVLNVYYTLTH